MRTFSLILLSLGLPLSALATSPGSISGLYPRQSYPGCSTPCAGTNSVNNSLYVCGDPRLGPAPGLLPKNLTYGYNVDNLLNPYNQFAGLCPNQFLAKWTVNGSYVYPPLNGFQLDINGAPIQGNVLLPVGFMMDRFGSEYGSFMGPLVAPFIQRALPPSSLNTDPSNPGYPFQYHVYNVSKPIVALAGPIAAWFGQPGQGTQYQFSVNIMTMVNGGYLTRVLSFGT